VTAQRTDKRYRLGLLGGTFDPIHTGHLLIAEVARHALSLDQVVFVPAGDPPHKGESVTAAEHRYAMVLLATADHPAFRVTRREMERAGPSYSLTTIREFRQKLGDSAELFFLTGADAMLEIRTWYCWQEVLRECRFAALARPGFDSAALLGLLPNDLRDQVVLLQAPGLDISSTEVRDRVRGGEPIRYLVPAPVESYIRKHGLYEEPRAAEQPVTPVASAQRP
jgi:nicotinate-nucleotide adenylyltransferase